MTTLKRTTKQHHNPGQKMESVDITSSKCVYMMDGSTREQWIAPVGACSIWIPRMVPSWGEWIPPSWHLWKKTSLTWFWQTHLRANIVCKNPPGTTPWSGIPKCIPSTANVQHSYPLSNPSIHRIKVSKGLDNFDSYIRMHSYGGMITTITPEYFCMISQILCVCCKVSIFFKIKTHLNKNIIMLYNY